MMSLLQDLKHGARLLLRSPGFSFVAVLALAIGIGANTAIFSVINTLLLQPLPYRDADRLAIVWEHNTVRDRKSNVSGKTGHSCIALRDRGDITIIEVQRRSSLR